MAGRREGIRFGRHASTAFWAGGLVLLAGGLLDLGTLWIAQRQETLQWEFVAVSRTTEAVPRIVLALALCHGALYLRRSDTLWAYRALAAGLLVLGVAGLVLGGLTFTQYVALSGAIDPGGIAPFRSSAIKTGALSALYALVLLPAGVIGLRRPKA